MSWLSNHALNAVLTGMSQLHRLRRCCQTEDVCQDAACLNTLMQDQDAWGGVYAADKLPHPKSSSTVVSYIVNSAPASRRGEHWLAIRLRPDTVEFFDSYGQTLWSYPLIYRWLQKVIKEGRRLYYYRQRIQGPHAYCGAYCYLLFAYCYFLCERPFSRSFYATLYDNPRFIFTSLDARDGDPERIKTYLSLNDSFVFNYLYHHAQGLLSMFTDNDK